MDAPSGIDPDASSSSKSTLDALTGEQIEALNWYYVVELKPGHSTQGSRFLNMLPTRKLLERVDFKGLSLLDIGTMEGAFSVLTAKAGAHVTSYDRAKLGDRVDLVKQAYGVKFDYRAGESFNDFSRQVGTFDFVLFSGVLYHTINPTVFLYQVRRLLPKGGLLLLESASIISDDAALFFNKEGRFFGFTNYYQPSTEWLDYYLRLLGCRILDVEYLLPPRKAYEDKRIGRVAMLCEVVGDSLLEESDAWGAQRLIFRELEEFGTLPEVPPVNLIDRVKPDDYAPELFYADLHPPSLRLTDVVNSKAPIERDKEACVLKLSDTL